MQLSGLTYMFQGSDSMDWAGGSHRPRGALGSSDEMRCQMVDEFFVKQQMAEKTFAR